MAERNNRPAWLQHRNFVPGRYNSFGEYIQLPRSQQWGEIMYEEELAQKAREEAAKVAQMEAWLAGANFGANDAAIKAQIRRIYDLDQLSKRAQFTYNVPNPQEGDFKRNASGKRFRYTTRYWKKINPTDPGYNAGKAAAAPARVNAPAVGDYKKIGNKVLVWTEEPVWLQVDRKTNYDVDLGDTFARYDALGTPYLDARDHLWSIFYPDEPPIRRRAAAAAPAAAGPGAAVRRGGAMTKTLLELMADLRADQSRATLDNVLSDLEVSEIPALERLANVAKTNLAIPRRPGLTEAARLAEVVDMVRYGMTYEAYVVQGLNRRDRRNTRRNRRRANRKNRKNTRKY
jgi:hypothetical protein